MRIAKPYFAPKLFNSSISSSKVFNQIFINTVKEPQFIEEISLNLKNGFMFPIIKVRRDDECTH